MCPSVPRVCSEPGAQKPVLSLSLDLIHNMFFTDHLLFFIWNGCRDHVRCRGILWDNWSICRIKSSLEWVVCSPCQWPTMAPPSWRPSVSTTLQLRCSSTSRRFRMTRWAMAPHPSRYWHVSCWRRPRRWWDIASIHRPSSQVGGKPRRLHARHWRPLLWTMGKYSTGLKLSL